MKVRAASTCLTNRALFPGTASFGWSPRRSRGQGLYTPEPAHGSPDHLPASLLTAPTPLPLLRVQRWCRVWRGCASARCSSPASAPELRRRRAGGTLRAAPRLPGAPRSSSAAAFSLLLRPPLPGARCSSNPCLELDPYSRYFLAFFFSFFSARIGCVSALGQPKPELPGELSDHCFCPLRCPTDFQALTDQGSERPGGCSEASRGGGTPGGRWERKFLQQSELGRRRCREGFHS